MSKLNSKLLITKLPIIVVLLFFLFTRFFNISKVSPSLYWDEASIAYNAYSVLTTGADEWGEFLPLHFRAFGEFKLPVYIYATSVSIAVFGFNDFAVRFPSVLFSLAAVIFTYLFVKQIYKNELIAWLSAFFLSITPWLFIFSRAGYEATAGLAFFTASLYFLSISTQKKIWFLFSIGALIISAYSYNSFRILSPLVFAAYSLYFYKASGFSLRSKLSLIFAAAAVCAISLIPVAKLFLLDNGGTRLQAVGLQGTTVQKSLAFLSNYFSHFSYSFLFDRGDSNLRSQMPGFGQLYLASLPLLLIGIYALFKKREAFDYLVLVLLLLSFIPASLTRESPHALRSLPAIPFFSMIIALGMSKLTDNWKKYSGWLVAGVALTYLLFFESFYYQFMNNYSSKAASDWQYGYRQIFENYKNEFDNYDLVVVSNEHAQPYIFAAYYMKIPPGQLRDTVEYNPVDTWGVSTVKRLGKFRFGINQSQYPANTLIFASVNENLNQSPIGTINSLNSQMVFKIYEY